MQNKLLGRFKGRNFILASLVFILSFLTFLVFFYKTEKGNTIDEIEKKLKEELVQKENKADHILEYMSQLFPDRVNLADFTDTLDYNKVSNQEMAFFIYQKKKLIFWTNNQVPIHGFTMDSLMATSFINLNNGGYEVRKIKKGDKDFIALLLIKHTYPYQNEYLQNKLSDDLDLLQDLRISNRNGEHNIQSKEGKFLFSIQLLSAYPPKSAFLLLGFLFFITLLLGYQWIFKIYEHWKWLFKKPILFWLLFFITVIGIRILMFIFKFPEVLYQSEFFSPKFYASSEWLPSLGDLLINSIIILYLSFLFFTRQPRILVYKTNRISINYFLAGLLIIIAVFLFKYIFILFKSIVINSDIPLNLNFIFNINELSVIALTIMTSSLLGFYFIFYKLIQWAGVFLGYKKLWILIIPVWAIILFIFNENRIAILLLLTVLFVWIGLTGNKIKYKKLFSHLGFLIIYISLFATTTILTSNYVREKEKRKNLAIQITKEHDPIAEYLFKDIQKKSEDDATLRLLVSQFPLSENHLISYLENNYFTGFWSKYRTQITICKPKQNLLIQPQNQSVDCKNYFDDKIEKLGMPTLTDNLYFLSFGAGFNSYVGIMEIPVIDKNDTQLTRIFIEMDPKTSMKELGYPELLIDKGVKLNADLSYYSYGLYDNGELIRNYGKYYYETELNYYINPQEGFVFFNKNGYSHLYYKISPRQDVIISIKQDGFIDVLSSFSYLLLFNVVLFSLLYGVFVIPFRKWKFELNLKERLQLSMIGLILGSFIVIGLLIMFYIFNINENKNQDGLSEKMNSVLIEIENKFSSFDTLDQQVKPFMVDQLNKLSNVFFCDINIFDKQGHLYASSRPKVFDEGLVSTLMHPLAYNELVFNQKAMFMQQENIGRLKFLSAYVPFKNDRNQLMAYVNLPYFARESDTKKDVSNFIVAFINIYVLLLAIAIIIAVVISSYITRPLQIIGSKIGRLALGKKNEKIIWKKNDEIGVLIDEYNRMTDELGKSAALLARSERESAWREMAKQVAHEIKNPLTPIKLSVQYLEKAWSDRVPDFDARMKRFSQTLVDQIDSLSAIASSFSDFAVMPQPQPEKVSILQVLTAALELCREKQFVKLNYEIPANKDYVTLADRQQLLRVFNNIVKNAIQALEDHPHGEISVKIEENQGYYVVSISDNGKGISAEQQDKIFVPNFTTKSYGMGLGLAMSRNIIEHFQGKIWFDSVLGEGTTFYVALLPC